jgi:hypothetical protein
MAGVPVSELAIQMEMTEVEAQVLVDLIETTLRKVAPNINTLVKNFMNYFVTNDIMTEGQTLSQDIEAYFVTKYGVDYQEDPLYWDDNYENHATIIFVANHVNTFFSSANQALVEGLITDLATLMKNEDIYTLNGMTLASVLELETKVNDAFDDLILLSSVIKNYNPASLTTEQLTKIQEFMDIFNQFMPTGEFNGKI